MNTNQGRGFHRLVASSLRSKGILVVFCVWCAHHTCAAPGPLGAQETLTNIVADMALDSGNALPQIETGPNFSDADWVSIVPGIMGANGLVEAMAVDESGNLYVGGDFTVIGTVLANGIAKWDGSRWSALGSGLGSTSDPGGTVSALTVSGTNLYAGGLFTTAGGVRATNIAKWDGSRWWALGPGISGSVDCLAVSGTNLYAGGAFRTAGTAAVNHITKWNGSTWCGLSSGLGGPVSALAVSGTNLYAGGSFTNAGPVRVNRIARWDGNEWSPLSSGIEGSVGALLVSGTDLYAGGVFTRAGEATATNVAKWDGRAWSALGSGLSRRVAALVVSGRKLYAAGNFASGPGVPAACAAEWNGSAWSTVGPGMIGSEFVPPLVKAIAVSRNNVFVGGDFTTSDDAMVRNIAKWSGSGWSPLNEGISAPSHGNYIGPWVTSLAVGGTNLYAGGFFSVSGRVPGKCIAKWDGRTWSALGAGMAGYGLETCVYALAASGSDVYAGGHFLAAGGVRANSIAKWDGDAWSPLGSGTYGSIYALAVSGSNVFAGGSFGTIGGVPANCVAKWDGQAWTALGSGLTGDRSGTVVYALAVGGTNLYVGGWFTQAGGVLATNIARWDGHAWASLGPPPKLDVCALAVSGTNLYAGGYSPTLHHVFRWDGNTWTPLGYLGLAEGFCINALLVSGTNLYAGGPFMMAYARPGRPLYRLARWDGAEWSGLGSGLDGGDHYYIAAGDTAVWALATDGAGRLFVGGNFFTAGTNLSPFIAQANIDPLNHRPLADASATRPVVISPNGTNSTVVLDGTRSSDPDGEILQYAWYRAGQAGPLAQGVVAVVVLPLGSYQIVLVVTDGVLSASTQVSVEVVSTAQALERLIARVSSSATRPRPLLATLEAALASLDRGNLIAAANQLHAFQNKVRAQIAPVDSLLSAAFLQETQDILDALFAADHGLPSRPNGKSISVVRLANGHTRIDYVGPLGRPCILQASTNLLDWENIGIATQGPDGTFTTEDPHAGKYATRFYRLVSP